MFSIRFERKLDRISERPTQPSWRWFIAWLLVGTTYIVSVLGALSIGPFVLLPAILATCLLARRAAARSAILGLIAGFGVAPLLVAYLNRDGPGTICTVTAGGSSCTEEWSPWPWLVVGCLLLAAGFGVFIMRRRVR